MPYFIDDKNCVRKGTKDDPGEVVKCHEDKEAATAHLRALYANVEDAKAVEDGAKGSSSSGWYNPPQGTHTAENAPNFAGGPGADREYGTESDEPPEGTRRCKCTKCGAVVVLPKGKQCQDIKCPACEGGMTQTEPREDKPAEGESGRQPKPGREKQADDCPECEASKQETHQCTCPECGASVRVPLGQKCNEVRCPKCEATMKQGTSGADDEEKAMDAPGPTLHGEGGAIGDTARVMDDGEGAEECKCPHCGKGIPCTAKACPYCKQSIDKVERGEDEKMDADKADWSASTVNDLPDSAFLYVESGEKDSEGKTTPRSKRHLPYKDASGKVDLPHLRNALSRLGQSKTGSGDGWLTPELRKRLRAKAEGILSKHGGGEEKSFTVYKSVSGEWRWLSISNWAVVDKEAEVISEQAYRDAIAYAQKTGEYGQLDLVHVDGTDAGDADVLFILKSGDDPAKFGAGGTWHDTDKATRAREAIQADPAYWGVSLKFRFNPARRVGGIYTGDIQVLKHSILPQHMAASYGTAIAVQGQGGANMSKKLDEKAAEALRQLGHTEDEIAELAEKNKALPDEENVVEKEDTTGAETAPAERSTIWTELGKLLGIKSAPVASEPEEARKANEVTSPASTAEPAEKAGGGEPSGTDAEDAVRAFGEVIAKSIGERVQQELQARDKRIGELEAQIASLGESVEEKVEARLRDVPPVAKVAASTLAATAAPDARKGLTFGSTPPGMQEYAKSLMADIQRVVDDKVAQFRV